MPPPLILLLQVAQEPLHLLPRHPQRLLAVEQHVEHAAGLGAAGGDVAPLVGRGALDADVAAAHDAGLAAVEGEFELALEDDAVVDGHGAVEGGLEAGAEVDEADDGAVGDVEAGLETGEVSGREGGRGKRGRGEKTHLVLPRVFDVLVPVQLHRRLLRRIRYHRHGLLFAHDAVVVPGVRDEEVPLAVGAVARDEALGLAEAGGRVARGDEVVGCGGHFFCGGLGRWGDLCGCLGVGKDAGFLFFSWFFLFLID